MGKRLTWKEMQERYPDKWVFVKNAEKDGPDIISGEVISVCDDDGYGNQCVEFIKSGIKFDKERTTHDWFGGGIIHAENVTISIE